MRVRDPRFQESIVSEKLSRRKFVAGGAAIVAAGTRMAQSQQSQRVAARGIKPVVISAANGHHFKNGGKVTCVEKAFAMMTAGADVHGCRDRGRQHPGA